MIPDLDAEKSVDSNERLGIVSGHSQLFTVQRWSLGSRRHFLLKFF